jgi:cytoskeletal protein CcmA (bactofilin family)
MTMFTRNDKTPDQNSAEPARPQSTTTTAAQAPRAQATTQPHSGTPMTSSQNVSVISKALKITGQLESTEDIRIDGEVNGDVRAVSVTVGPNARVKGTVHGDAVELAGTVEGKIEAKKVVLASTAKMTGDVVHQDIKIESGAFVDGHLKPEFGKQETKGLSQIKPVASAPRETPKPASDVAARA